MIQRKKIMVAVDESENAKNALLYVADILGGIPGFRIVLVSVLPVPDSDFFGSEEERKDWLHKKHAHMTELLERYRTIMVQSGFPDDDVLTEIVITKKKSVSATILEKQEQYDACTLVVGRRGVTGQEEFLFGSVSNKLIHMAARCAIWVVEPACRTPF